MENHNHDLPAAAGSRQPCNGESKPYFFPSQVNLSRMFVGTFDHSEAENTAAVIVKVLASNGDVFRSATCDELAAGFQDLTKHEGPWRSWFNNPFAKIDMHDLIDRGFAEWDGDRAIKFTDKGLDRMEKWVNRESLAQGRGLAPAGGKDS